MAKLGSDIQRAVKRTRDEYRLRRLAEGEQGWGRPVVPSPVLPVGPDQARRVAIVGAGQQGRMLARGVTSVVGAELVGIADLDLDRAVEAVQGVGLSDGCAFEDASSMFRGTEPDLAVIATTAPSHVVLAEAALDAGVGRLLVEKPIATSYRDAAALVRRCERAQVPLAVGYGRRWLTDHRAIADTIAAGEIGPVRIISVQVGSGELAMQGSHFVDLCRMLVRDDVVEVGARLRPSSRPNVRGGDFDDPTGVVWLRFGRGARATIDFEEDLPPRDVVVVIRGDHGLIVLEEHQQVWSLRGRSGRTFTFPLAEPFRPLTVATRVMYGVLRDDTPSCDGDDGLAALDVILAAHHSSEDHSRVVSLPLDEDARSLVARFP